MIPNRTYIVREVKAKNIITQSSLPTADYVINPHIGCTHARIYCYASLMKRFTGHGEAWGTCLHVKVDAPDFIPGKSNSIPHAFKIELMP